MAEASARVAVPGCDVRVECCLCRRDECVVRGGSDTSRNYQRSWVDDSRNARRHIAPVGGVDPGRGQRDLPVGPTSV